DVLCAAEKRRDELGDIHRAAAAQADYRIGPRIARRDERPLKRVDRRLAMRAIEDRSGIALQRRLQRIGGAARGSAADNKNAAVFKRDKVFSAASRAPCAKDER